MNNFNNVFLAIKRTCDTDGELNGPGCFETIAEQAGLPPWQIEFVLNTLQDLKLIKFSVKEHYIRLTIYGKMQEKVFAGS